MQGTSETDRQLQPTKLLEALTYAIAVGTFGYFILCFVFVYTFCSRFDLNVLFYLSFQDYLKAGIQLNLFLAIMLTLLVFSFKAGFHLFPPEYDSWEVDWLTGKTRTALALLIVVITVIQTFLTMMHFQYLAETILFWALAAAIFLFAILSLDIRFILPAVIFSVCIIVNIVNGKSASQSYTESVGQYEDPSDRTSATAGNWNNGLSDR